MHLPNFCTLSREAKENLSNEAAEFIERFGCASQFVPQGC
ncbi:MAG: hypothetical protein QOF74_1687 [Caballeronia mineralivorans]|jgi:hypothetical protein|nr:hypothetical protein [Caballeronia mineralivorans]